MNLDNKSIGKKAKSYVLLHAILLIYSFCSVFSKFAAQAEFLSFNFILFYGLMLIVLAIYALLWQQVLKTMPLTTAFANKAIVIVWGMLWGEIIFAEQIKWQMILGSVIIFLGIVLVVTDSE